MTELYQKILNIQCELHSANAAFQLTGQAIIRYFQSVHSEISTLSLIPDPVGLVLHYISGCSILWDSRQADKVCFSFASQNLYIMDFRFLRLHSFTLYNVSSSQLWHYFNWTKVKVKVKGLVSRFFGIDNRSRERPSLASPALITGIYWAMQPREG